MDIDLEIHSPGLDLHHKRWNYHVLFMDEVHDEFDRIAARAREGYREHGRGTVFVDKDRWITVIRGEWDREKRTFPCDYIVPSDADIERFAPLREGFKELVRKYDPEKQVVLTVEHHSAGMLSTYLVRGEGNAE